MLKLRNDLHHGVGLTAAGNYWLKCAEKEQLGLQW